MKVLILGMGYTGRRLGHWLTHRGVSVVGTNRSGQKVPGVSVPIVQFDLQSSSFCEVSFWEDFKTVTHILSTIAPTPTGTDPAWSLLQHHPNPASIQWAGYISTTGVYGDTGGAWVDEWSAAQPRNERSKVRVEIEQQWQRSGLPVHLFRLPGIYGPHRSIFDKIKAAKAQQIIKPGHVFSRVHVDDIVQTIGQSMSRPTPGEIYNVADDEPSEPRELLLEGAALLNVEPPPPIPFEQAKLSPMGQSFWAECRRVSNHKIKEKLGITLRYPSYREGLRAILKEL